MKASVFKQIILPCSRKMYLAAWRLTGNAQASEDLVQETMLKLWTIRERIAPESNIEAYCVTVLRNIFYDRHRLRHLDMDGTPVGSLRVRTDDDVAGFVEKTDDTATVMQLIEHLPPQQRMIITMRDVRGLSFDEIETSTGMTGVNIRATLSRARKQIREQFKKISEYGCK